MTAAGRRFDLICFDVDGTLVVHPEEKVVWQVLNERFTGGHEVNDDRFEQYLAGRISYARWVALDIGDWQRAGATRDQVVAALGALSLVAGAREAIAALKATGARLAVVSGTLDICLDLLFPDHPFDEVHSNTISLSNSSSRIDWSLN